MTTPTMAEVLATTLELFSNNLFVALPGKVLSYDSDAQTAKVQFLARRWLPTSDEAVDQEQRLPDHPEVPVLPYGGGGFFMHAPLAAGDFVLVLFLDTDFSDFYAYGAVRGAQDRRLHDLSHAVAIPLGLRPRSKKLTSLGSALVFGREEGIRIEVTSGDEMHVGGSSDAAAKGSVVNAILSAIAASSPSGAETGLAAIKSALTAYTDSKSSVLKIGG